MRALKKEKKKSIASHKLDIVTAIGVLLLPTFYSLPEYSHVSAIWLFVCFFFVKKERKRREKAIVFFYLWDMCRYVNIACPKLSVVKVLLARTYFHVKAKYTAWAFVSFII